MTDTQTPFMDHLSNNPNPNAPYPYQSAKQYLEWCNQNALTNSYRKLVLKDTLTRNLINYVINKGNTSKEYNNLFEYMGLLSIEFPTQAENLQQIKGSISRYGFFDHSIMCREVASQINVDDLSSTYAERFLKFF